MSIVRLGVLGVGVTASLLACSTGDDRMAREPAADDVDPRVVDLSVANRAFHAPDTLDAGWTTFRFTNDTDEAVHYAHFVRLDSGRSVQDWWSTTLKRSGNRARVRPGSCGSVDPAVQARTRRGASPRISSLAAMYGSAP